MGTMLRLSLRQMAGRKRLALIFALAALPVGMAIILNAFVSGEEEFNQEFINLIIDGLIVGAVMPIVVMTLATAAFGNELEDRTLNVLVLKPVARFTIVLPKLLGSIIVAGPLIVVTGAAVTMIALGDGGTKAVVATSVALLAGTVAYASMFTWAGLISAKALGFVIVYVFLWEGLLSSFLSDKSFLSVRGYTLGILHGLDEDTFSSIENRVLDFPVAIGAAAIVTVLFFWLTLRRLHNMDVQ
jgi:ABC-2 type transport system permease protein